MKGRETLTMSNWFAGLHTHQQYQPPHVHFNTNPMSYMQGICACIYHESKPNAVPCMDADMDTLLRRLLDL